LYILHQIIVFYTLKIGKFYIMAVLYIVQKRTIGTMNPTSTEELPNNHPSRKRRKGRSKR